MNENNSKLDIDENISKKIKELIKLFNDKCIESFSIEMYFVIDEISKYIEKNKDEKLNDIWKNYTKTLTANI